MRSMPLTRNRAMLQNKIRPFGNNAALAGARQRRPVRTGSLNRH
jgi:hypothetical protein